ncbi:MAG: peptidase [Gammaproteobacteria bacterium]|nr:MAG: peptidase [Gammaproteobacteria bacterium]
MTGYKFSHASRAQLDTCHPDLVRLFEEIIRHRDCTIVEGKRDKARQDELLRQGTTTLAWPKSKHNVLGPNSLSLAVDAAPYFSGEGIPWDDRERWLAWGGFVRGVAAPMGIDVRWGGDWSGDWIFADQKFHDMPHFELVE